MRITGILLDVEDYSGDFKDAQTGNTVSYAGKRLHVLDGREVIKVKVAKENLNKIRYETGEAVDLRVIVAAQAGGRGPYLTVTLLGDFEETPLLALAQA